MAALRKVRICEECQHHWCSANTECPMCRSLESCKYVPTPAEIIESREAIKAAWSTNERISRWVGPGRVPAGLALVAPVGYRNGRPICYHAGAI